MSISRWNFSFQHKRSELQPHIWRLHKILRHSFSAWSKIKDVDANFFHVFYVFSASNYVRKPSQNSDIREMKFNIEIEIFKVKGVCGNFFTFFYVFRASNYIQKPSRKLAYIWNKIWRWIGDFQGQGCLWEFFYYFFHIQRVKLRTAISPQLKG